MVITQISRRRQHLCEIVFDMGKSILLDSDYCAEKALKEGNELRDSDIAKMQAESDYKRAVSRSLWYIERGDLSQKGLRDKLKKAGFSATVCEKAVERMVELGLINDEQYALRLAENLLGSCVSKREAAVKMQQRGIPREVALWALDEFECDAQQQIKALILKKYKNKLQSGEDVKKVFAALQRKGFNYGDIKSVLKWYSEEIMYSEE